MRSIVSGALGILYALFALVCLPRTPPQPDQAHPLAWARAFALLKSPGMLVITLVGLPIAMIHTAYFFRVNPFLTDAVDIPLKWTGLILSLGQWSELVFLALLALFIKRLGYKWVLALGGLAYVLRFAIFASTDSVPLIAVAQGLHGLCYGCFFAGSYIYVDRIAPPDIRHSAQTAFGIIMLGLGPILAGFYNQIFDRFQIDGARLRAVLVDTGRCGALVHARADRILQARCPRRRCLGDRRRASRRIGSADVRRGHAW